MDWDTLVQQVFAQVGTAAAVVGGLALVGRLAVEHYFKAGLEELKNDLKKRTELELLGIKNKFESDLLVEKTNAEKGIFLFQHGVETRAAGDERVRRELLAWANPILNAVEDLGARLTNILDEKGYEGLDSQTATLNPDWSMDHDYFLTSTLYQFSRYFCWIGMLEEELSFEVFRSHKEMNEFMSNVIAVSRALGDYPPRYDGAGNDTQVFRLQQRAIGQAMAIREGRRRSCLGYNVFVSRRADAADKEVRPFLAPLEKLVDGLKPGERRFARLNAVRNALKGLEEHCRSLLVVPKA